jgi:uncharacterized membrane protein
VTEAVLEASMHFLTILLLFIGVVVVIGASMMACSYALGRFFYSHEAVGAVPMPSEQCARCAADAEWYASLPAWKQSLTLGWWLTNRVICAINGCR